MKNFINTLKECLKSGYKREFYFWLFSILFFCGGLFWLTIEIKHFIVLKESKEKIEISFVNTQTQIYTYKSLFAKIDWNKEFQKSLTPLKFSISLKNINQAIKTLQNLSSEENSFLVIKEARYKSEKDKEPILYINADLIRFY